MENYDIYFVDFDGTIFDSAESCVIVFQRAFASLGEGCTREQAFAYMHINLVQTMDLRKIPEEKRIGFMDDILEGLDSEESLQKIKIFPETVQFLQELKKQGKTVGVVSNNNSKHIRLVLKYFGIEDLFDVVVGSDMFKHGKPSAEPIDTGLKVLGQSKEEKRVVYIGDSLQDPECAYNAKVAGILIDRHEEYPDFQGTRISSLLDAIPVLRK